MLDNYLKLQKFFDDKAETWRLSDCSEGQIGRILREVCFQPRDTILDLGCGTGRILPYIVQTAPQPSNIVGIDLSLNMLKSVAWEKRAFCHLAQGLAEELPLRDRSVEVIMNYCIFPHFMDKAAVLREYYRVLKSDGRLYIVHPEGIRGTNRIHRKAGGPVCRHLLPSGDKLGLLLSEAGFSIAKMIDLDDLFFIEARKVVSC